jgi:hypothetical protein
MPLQLNDEEMDLLLALAAPIDQRQRDQFLHEVAAELEAASAQTGVGPGPGALHRNRAGRSAKIFRSARIAQRVAALPQHGLTKIVRVDENPAQNS